MAKQQQFTCPICGSHEYGSDLDGVWRGTKAVMRSCHGTTAAGQSCRFAWPIDHDVHYFTDTEYEAPDGPFVATGWPPMVEPSELGAMLLRWRSEIGPTALLGIRLRLDVTGDEIDFSSSSAIVDKSIASEVMAHMRRIARERAAPCAFTISGTRDGVRVLGFARCSMLPDATSSEASASAAASVMPTLDLSVLTALLEGWRREIGPVDALNVDLLYVDEQDHLVCSYDREAAGSEGAVARRIAQDMVGFTTDRARGCTFKIVSKRNNADVLGRVSCRVELHAREAGPKAPMVAAVAEAAAGATTAPRNSVDVQEIVALLKGARDLYSLADPILLQAFDLRSPAEACVVVRSNSVGEDAVRAGQVGAGILNRAATMGGPCHFVLIVEDARTGRHLASMRFSIEVRAAVAEAAEQAPAMAPVPTPAVAPAAPPVVDPHAPESSSRRLSAHIFAQLDEWAKVLTEGSGENGRTLILDIEQHGSGIGAVASYRVKSDLGLGVAADRIARRLESFTRSLGRTELDFMIYAKDQQSGVLLGRQPALCTIDAPVAPTPPPTAVAPLASFSFPVAPARDREELIGVIAAQFRAWANATMMSTGERHRAIVLDVEQVDGSEAKPCARYVVHTDHDLGAAAALLVGNLRNLTQEQERAEADFMIYAKDQQSGAAIGWLPARCTLDAPASPPIRAAKPAPPPAASPASLPARATLSEVMEACARVAHNAMRAFRFAVLAEHSDLEFDVASVAERAVSLKMAHAVIRGLTDQQMHDLARIEYLAGVAATGRYSAKDRPYLVRYDALPANERAAFVVFRAAALGALKSLRVLGVMT